MMKTFQMETYAQLNKSDRERQMLYDLSYTWNLKK